MSHKAKYQALIELLRERNRQINEKEIMESHAKKQRKKEPLVRLDQEFFLKNDEKDNAFF